MNRKNFIKSSILALIGLPLLGKPETPLESLQRATKEIDRLLVEQNIKQQWIMHPDIYNEIKSKPLREGYQSLSVEFDKIDINDFDKVKVIYE